MSSKFKFCFLEFHGIFFFQIFPILWMNTMDMQILKGRLYFLFSKYQIPSKYIIPYTISNYSTFTGLFCLFDFALTCHVTYCHESLDVASNQKKLHMVTFCMRGVNT